LSPSFNLPCAGALLISVTIGGVDFIALHSHLPFQVLTFCRVSRKKSGDKTRPAMSKWSEMQGNTEDPKITRGAKAPDRSDKAWCRRVRGSARPAKAVCERL